MQRPLVFVGPSGIGKGTIINKLRELYPDAFSFSISHTTRKPREGEINGVHYHFVTKEKFMEMVENDELIEHAQIHENYYGTSKQAIDEVVKTGKICILDLNIDGAISIYNSDMKPFILLLKPTSFEELEMRLRNRGKENEEQIQTRLKTTRTELVRFEENKEIFDLVIVNDRLEMTVAKLSGELFKIYNLN